MNRKYRIAFTGVFDLENYGDHLFPVIFKTQLEKQEVDCEIVLFSIFSCIEGFGQHTQVYSIYDIDKMHEQVPFDAVVVGGGEIVHFNLCKHKMNNRYLDYPIFDLWIVPSLFAQKYHVKLIWNAVGIPFDFSEGADIFVREVVNVVDYLAVRNTKSKNALKQCGIEKEIVVIPDTGLLLRETYGEDFDLSDVLGFNPDDQYVVIHLNKLMPVSEHKEFKCVLSYLCDLEYKIVMLPLAYTNDDDIFMREITQKLQNSIIIIEKKLTLRDIVGTIARCDLYIGVSFHGAITAYAYGKKAIMYNYAKNRKSIDLFDMFSRTQYYAETADKLKEKVEMALRDKRRFNENNEEISKELRKHFGQIKQLLLLPTKICNFRKNYIDYSLLSRIISKVSIDRQFFLEKCDQLLRERETYAERLEISNEGWHMCVEELERTKEGWKKCAKELEETDIKWKECTKELEEADIKWKECTKELERVNAEWKKCAVELEETDTKWKECTKELERVNAEWKKCAAELERANIGWEESLALLENKGERYTKYISDYCDQYWSTQVIEPVINPDYSLVDYGIDDYNQHENSVSFHVVLENTGEDEWTALNKIKVCIFNETDTGIRAYIEANDHVLPGDKYTFHFDNVSLSKENLIYITMCQEGNMYFGPKEEIKFSLEDM